MVSVVYGVSQASTDGWGSNSAWPFMALGAVLLGLFFVIESRIKTPLLPLRLVMDRVRGGSYLSQVLVGLGLFGMFLFMTFYFQNVHQYSAVKSGLLFLPFSVGVIISATAASQLLPRIGPRPLGTVGCFMGATGLFYLSFIGPNSSYLGHVMPAMIVASLGLGLAFVTISSTALFNVGPQDAGAASAVLQTAQQIGGSFGTAIQNTIFVSSETAFVALSLRHSGVKTVSMALHDAAYVHGFDLAFRFGSLMLLLASIEFYLLVNIDRHHLGQHDEVAVAAL